MIYKPMKNSWEIRSEKNIFSLILPPPPLKKKNIFSLFISLLLNSTVFWHQTDIQFVKFVQLWNFVESISFVQLWYLGVLQYAWNLCSVRLLTRFWLYMQTQTHNTVGQHFLFLLTTPIVIFWLKALIGLCVVSCVRLIIFGHTFILPTFWCTNEITSN